MTQEAIDYGPEARDLDRGVNLVRCLTAAIRSLPGQGETLCIRCEKQGMTSGNLSMALSGARPFQARWLAPLLELLGKFGQWEHQVAVLNALAEPFGFEVKRKKRLTDKQRADAMREALLMFGAAGKRAADEVDQ